MVAFFEPAIALWLLPLSLYLSFCAGVLTHYHNHRAVFHGRLLNKIYSLWLSVFYGFPIFSWIPTHNKNHHRYQNGPGDNTSTDKLRGGDGFFQLLSYPTRSSAWQAPALLSYLRSLRKKRSSAFRWAVAQTVVIPLFHLATFATFAVSYDVVTALDVYLLLVLIPALFAPWSMMVINYVQHIGCDANSADNHSRNFVGKWENWLVFDAGLHTVHHEHPGVHFSEYQRLHDARKDRIAPDLNQRNVLSFMIAHYVLAPLQRLSVRQRSMQ
jgi:fatty acid desaturase